MRLIDADTLKKAIIRHLCVKSENNLLPAEKSIYNLIDEQPTIEQPKKGHWIIDDYDYLDCSCCGESYYTGCDSTKEAQERLEKGQVYTYCPYCGAYMKDGDGE